MSRDRSILVFGAGAAGKGLIGLQFSRAGYRITFADIDSDLVARLKVAGSYRVVLHRLSGGQDEQQVDGIRMVHAGERAVLAERMVDADFVMTAVFPQNLPDVAQTIAQGVACCRQAGRERPLHVIACENMKRSSSTLHGYVSSLLGDTDRAYLDAVFAFPDAMINRVVPTPADPLLLETEDYCEWTVEAGAVKGAWPKDMDFIEPVNNQAARLDRKLFIYNGSHAACAYFGHQQGCTWIHEALDHPRVAPEVAGILDELGAVVRRHHGFSRESIESYKNDFRRRCRNQGLKDAIARIGRNPTRKLGGQERLIAPAKLAAAYGLPRTHLLRAIASALAFVHPDDPDSQEMARRIARDGWRKALCTVSGLEETDPLLNELGATMERTRGVRPTF